MAASLLFRNLVTAWRLRALTSDVGGPVLRRLLDSPWTYFALAALLALGGLASMFRIRGPARPSGTIEQDLGKLR